MGKKDSDDDAGCHEGSITTPGSPHIGCHHRISHELFSILLFLDHHTDLYNSWLASFSYYFSRTLTYRFTFFIITRNRCLRSYILFSL